MSPTSPSRHQQAQPVTGGPLRAACLGSCPPSLQLAWSFHAMLILAKNPFSQPSTKPKSQGWSQEAAEVFGYHRTEAESLARRWPGHTRGSCSLWGEHSGQSHIQGLCMSRCNSRLSVGPPCHGRGWEGGAGHLGKPKLKSQAQTKEARRTRCCWSPAKEQSPLGADSGGPARVRMGHCRDQAGRGGLRGKKCLASKNTFLLWGQLSKALLSWAR